MSTTIQILALRDNSTFDQPVTPDGRQWKIALNYLTTCPGWYYTFWGRHLEDRKHVTLFIDWKAASTARAFLAEHFDSFAALLTPLLASTPDLPHCTELSPNGLEPAFQPGGGVLTTISKLTYSSMSAYQRKHLLPSTFDIYVQELGHSVQEENNLEEEYIEYMGGPPASPPKEDVKVGFMGGSAAWAVDNETREPTATLWMMVGWKSLEAEELCEKTLQTNSGKNMKEAFLGSMLEKADPGAEVYHVAWEMLTKDIATWWMDSDNPIWPYKPLKEQPSKN